MKKTYTSPTIDIYKLELQQMLASSVLAPVDNPDVVISSDTEDSGFFSAHDGEDFSFFEEEEFKF